MGWQDGIPVEAAPAPAASQPAWMQGTPVSNNAQPGVQAYVEKKKREAALKEADPTGSFFQNLAAGGGRAFDSAARGLEEIVKDVGNRTSVGGKQLVSDADLAEVKARSDVAAQTDKPLMGTVGGNMGEVAGNIAMTAGLPVGSAKSAAAVGGGLGAVQPVGNEGSRLLNTGLGVGGGAAGNLLLRGAARVVRPNTAPEVRALLDEGATLTPGQALGGGFKATEEKLTSVPILGDLIKKAQGRGIDDFNRMAYTRALKPIGEEAGKAFPVGREGVELVGSKLGDAYNALLPKVQFKADQQLGQEITALQQMVAAGLPEAQAKQFERVLKEQLVRRMTPQGNMSGDTLKIVESELGRLAKGYRGAQSFDERQLGDAIGTLQQHIRENLARNNPAYATELKAINEGYANYARIRDAASRQGAESGVFTPAMLSSAVRAGDKSVGKGDYAKGNALMQDLTDNARGVISNKYPDSGTAGRGMLGLLGAGAAGGMVNPMIPVGIGAGAAMYTRPGQKMLSTLLTERPEIAEQAALAIRKGVPLSSLLGASASQLQSQ